MSEVKVGLFAPLRAADGKAGDLSDFLVTGHGMLSAEPLTQTWYAVKYTGSALDPSKDSTLKGDYAIFDTFATEDGRKAHVTGSIAAALVQNAPTLLEGGPEINKVDILASKVVKADCKVGLRVLMEAKPEKAEEVQKFLIGACDLVVKTEPLTPQWYAVRFTDASGAPTNKFGIFDFSEGEEGRTAHVQGEVAAALFKKAEEFFDVGPEVIKVDVVASRVL